MFNWLRRQFERDWPEGSYREQIQVLKSDVPLPLPSVKPLKGRVVKHKKSAKPEKLRRVS